MEREALKGKDGRKGKVGKEKGMLEREGWNRKGREGWKGKGREGWNVKEKVRKRK